MREYVDFLGAQSPYDALDAADLAALARLIEVEFFGSGTTIVEAGGSALAHFYVIRTGEVEILDRGRAVDVLGPGETFGQISVLSGLPPPLSARAAEDTLCYRFPDPRPALQHPERLQFSHYGSLVTRERLARSGLVDQALRSARNQMRPVVWCPPQATVSEAAAVMTEAGQSCALLRRGDEVGIVTDSDFRTGLATGHVNGHTPVAMLASFPAATIGADTLIGDAFLRMVECGFHHLVVTGAGEKPVGILRVVDLASAEVRNPLVIRRAVDEASTVDELAAAAALLPSTWLELYDTGVAVMHIAGLLSAVIDSIMLRLIELTDIGDDAVPQQVSWLLLGSVARREPLPRSDLDTSIVWEDLPQQPSPALGRSDTRQHGAVRPATVFRRRQRHQSPIRPIPIRCHRPGDVMDHQPIAGQCPAAVIDDRRQSTRHGDCAGAGGIRCHARHDPWPRLSVDAPALHDLRASPGGLRAELRRGALRGAPRPARPEGRRPGADRLAGALDRGGERR
jgi:CBS domain-containing protein